MCSYSVSFVEDGPPVFPLDTPDLTIADDDNSFLLRATLVLVSSDQLPTSVQDRLFGVSNDRFNVTQNSLSELVVEAIGPRRLITLHADFVEFLRTIGFSTNDQAPFVTRNFSLVVEEFPLGEVLSLPFFLPIEVLPVNDRPIFSPSTNTEVLNDYLPQESNNLGFNASFLVSESEVFDVDSQSPVATDFIGLAVTVANALESLGVWQYWSLDESEWINIPGDISSCTPLLLNPSQNIRFSPAPNREKLDGIAGIQFRVWDGSSVDISADCVNGTLEVTAGKQVLQVLKDT